MIVSGRRHIRSKKATLAAIQSDNPGLDLEFWEILLS
jgi:hypothetical protein